MNIIFDEYYIRWILLIKIGRNHQNIKNIRILEKNVNQVEETAGDEDDFFGDIEIPTAVARLGRTNHVNYWQANRRTTCALENNV